ncbi:MAG: hypothetical protein AB8G77_08195 [Rhodothermales bacterium]
MLLRVAGFLLMVVFFVPALFAQSSEDVSQDSTETVSLLPNIFVDCDFCNSTYIRRQLEFANHVRDQDDADIYILVTSQQTGSGGRAYKLAFEGKNEFAGIEHTLEHSARQDETDDERRSGRMRVLKMGLMPYMAMAGKATDFDIDYEAVTSTGQIGLGQDDPWNNWVFNISVGGGYEGEEREEQLEFEGGFRVQRVTEAFKVVADLDVEIEEETFDSGEETIRSKVSEVDVDVFLVKSINDHWSYGVVTGFRAATFTNIKGRVDINPAIEFNVYPWEESDRRSITFAYFPGVQRVVYNLETLFGKTSETIFRHTLRAQLDFEQPWGEVFAQIEGSHLLNDFSKNRLELFSFVDVRVARGVSVFLRGSAEIIHDQLFLPKGDASLEEVLLRQRQLATDFELSAEIGLRFTFGSTYNNVVNPRL